MKRALILFALLEAAIIAGLVLFLLTDLSRWALWALGAAMAAELLLGIGLLIGLRRTKGN